MTALKSLLFFIFVPGTVMGYVPFMIAAGDAEFIDLGVLRYLAVPLWLVSGLAVLWCFWDFTFKGRGTPAPIDPPKELVAVGLYRFVRNPMYVSGVIALIGWILWSPSFSMILTPILFFVAAHLFVTLYEEPTLKKKFGAAYEAYCQRIPRWIPRFSK